MFTSRAGLFRRGPLAGWAVPLRGPRYGLLARADGKAEWAEPVRVGPRSRIRFS